MRGATEVYDTYWRFAAERQRILLRRLDGALGPWTDDPVLRTYRFTNAYRATDRVSQYLISRVIYDPARPSSAPELFARILLFKIFNKIETWEFIERRLGTFVWAKTDLDALSTALNDAMDRGLSIYSAAYIMPSPPYGFGRKHENHIALLRKMMDAQVWREVACAKSLASVYGILREWPGLGPFLAFQYAIDLNYSPLINFDEEDFVVAGPGAIDGISKCFSSRGRASVEEVIYSVCEAQHAEFAARDIEFDYIQGRPLKPIDCQNLFCEISKYARVAHPDIVGVAGRTRIKQSFRHSPSPQPPLFLPPKWASERRR